MTTPTGSGTFYGSIPVFRGFSSLMDPELYSALPDDWIIGIADIMESTRAIAEARYKAVNMAGASVIAAVANALEGREFPFVFGGDGASFAVSPDDFDRTREAMAATAIWVEESLDLEMRVALVPVTAVRAQGLDVRVARFGPQGARRGAGSLPAQGRREEHRRGNRVRRRPLAADERAAVGTGRHQFAGQCS